MKDTTASTQIYDNVYRLEDDLGGKPLYLYFFDGKLRVLLDTGVRETPHKLVIPFLKSIGLKTKSINLAIITHADSDHFGGNSELKSISPGTILAAHIFDRELIENPDIIIEKRYNQFSKDHSISLSEDAWKATRSMMGSSQKLDVLLRGGEILNIDEEMETEVMHVPGHTHGHIALYLRKKRALFIGDAVLWRYVPKTDGTPALAPTYIYVDEYLESIRRMIELRPNAIYAAHFPPMKNSEAIKFLRESEQFALKLEHDLEDIIQNSAHPLSLRELINKIFTMYGFYPESTRMDLAFPISGHLERLLKKGSISKKKSAGVTVYTKS